MPQRAPCSKAASVISKDDMMPVLVDVCPSFNAQWLAFLDEWREEKHDLPLYVALGDFARHMIGMLEGGETDAFPSIFAAIERLEMEGDDYVKEAATVGLLESLQNLNLHTTTSPEKFLLYLGPESARCWDEVRRSWEGYWRWASES
jgi:hypothetical protein